MQSSLLLGLVLVGAALAQDTYHCPDGWDLEEDRSGCRCFMFGGNEDVTRDDADILCEFHEAWVAELDHPGQKIYFNADDPWPQNFYHPQF